METGCLRPVFYKNISDLSVVENLVTLMPDRLMDYGI